MDQNKPQETAQDQEQIAGSNRSKLTRSKLIPTKKNKSFKLGRPTKYDPKLCKGIIDFFTQDLYHQRIKSTITQKNGSVVENYELVPNPPLFINEYAYSIGCTHKTLENWTKKHPDFLLAFMRVKQMIQEHIIKLANIGLFNSNFATFTMKNISTWRDKKDLELSGKVDSQVFFASMLTNSKEAIQNERLVLGAN